MMGFAHVVNNVAAVQFTITKNFLLGLLGVLLIIFLLISIALEYHWLRYGLKSPRVILAEIAYFLVSIVLFGAALVTIGVF